jgi:hypothetical protein
MGLCRKWNTALKGQPKLFNGSVFKIYMHYKKALLTFLAHATTKKMMYRADSECSIEQEELVSCSSDYSTRLLSIKGTFNNV